jgi:beta-N-acetylhexosaminidase
MFFGLHKKKIFFLLLLLFFSFLLPAESSSLQQTVTFWSDYPAEQLAEILVGRMTDEELLAQIFMFGWAGAEPSELLNRWVSDRGLGSVKVFGWNTDNTELVARSVASLQRKAAKRPLQIPLFVATDQEGGWIRHVKGNTSETPGNLAIGASGYPVDAWYSAYYICREIWALGINMNFAPVVDLYTNHYSSVIGPRSFGEDPCKAGILGASFAAGCEAAGVIPTAKHFPGHGDTDYDSHIRLPVINISYDTLLNRELVPFRFLIAENIPAIMSGHLSFPQVDKSGAPASLSPLFLNDILRTTLGYKGLIITDDMMMNGDTSFAGSLSNAFTLAIKAGNDIIISSTTARLHEALWTSNLELMRTDSAFRKRVSDAALRVIRAKLNYFKGKNPAPLYPDEKEQANRIPDPDAAPFFLEQACRSVTVYKAGDFPYRNSHGERVLLAGSLPDFFTEEKKRYPQAGEFRFSYEMGPNETAWMCDNIGKTAADYDTIIFCVANEHDVQVASKLKNLGKKVILLSIMSPVYVLDLTWADTILLGYSYSDYTFAALAGALSGEYKPEGYLPLTND